MSALLDQMIAVLTRAGWTEDAAALERLEAFHAYLLERNQVMDLTNVPPEDMPVRHYLDSILPALRHPELFTRGASVVDVGSGAGFPGIPLAVFRPDLRVTLMEANGKRCDFLLEAVRRTGLSGVEVLQARAEEAGRNPLYRERFDLAVSRAVAPLPTLLEYLLPLTAVHGMALCWKGRRAAEETLAAATAARVLGGGLPQQLIYSGENDDASTLVTVSKEQSTDAAYPRRTGIPAKRPIL